MLEGLEARPEIALGLSSFWNPGACRRFLDRWDDLAFRDPVLGRRWAEVGLRLVAKVEARTAESTIGCPDLRARAWTLLGSACRQTCDLETAELAFDEAAKLYDAHRLLRDHADFQRRLAFLRRDQCRFADALDHAQRAVRAFHQLDDSQGCGMASTIEGQIYFEMGAIDEALGSYARALELLRFEACPNAFHTCIHNLAVALLAIPDPAPLESALLALELARQRIRSLTGSQDVEPRRSVPDAKLRILQGLILRRSGSYALAERLVEAGREDLILLGAPLDAAWVSLELGDIYLAQGRWPDLEKISWEAVQLLHRVPGANHLVEAFQGWQEAVNNRCQTATGQNLAGCRHRFFPPRRRRALTGEGNG